MKAKKAGDKKTANALKLVANTSYGAMLNGKNGISYNDLYDPLMGRSVCITGQLLASGISYKAPTGDIVNCEHDAIGNMAVAFVGTSGVQMGWLASQADMLANDWAE